MIAHPSAIQTADVLREPSKRYEGGSVMLPPNPPIAILGVPFDNVTTQQAIAAIEKMVASGVPHYLVTANVDFLVQSQTDVELRRILFDAHLVLCDGTPLLWASRFLGNPLPERVAGADIVPLLIRIAAKRKYRLFFLGATPEASQAAVDNLKRKYEELIIAGHYSPPFGKLLEMDHEEIKRRIHAAKPDLLFVSFGCPKQEKWIAMHYRSLGVPVAAGVGATIDFLSGHVKRAPVWMQRIGTEWVFRLAQEPSRLLGRYAKDLWVFGRRILAQWWQLQWAADRRIAVKQGVGSMEKNPIATLPSQETFQLFRLPERLDFMAISHGALRIEKILSDGRNCLLAMDNIEFIDSTGIGMLIHLQKKLRARGQLLFLIAPSVAIKSSLKLMQLQEFFTAAADIKEAEHLLEARKLELQSITHPGDILRSNVLRWQGEITAVNAEQVWEISRAFLESASEASQPEITIDISAVRFIDSSGLGVMVRTRKLAQRHGTKLVFSAAQPAVQNVLRLSRLDEFLMGASQPKAAPRRG